MITQADGRYKSHLRTVSIKADIGIQPITHKTSDTQPDFRVVTEADEIGVGWMHKGETSNKEFVRFSIAAPEFGPKIFYGNFGKAAGSDNKDVYAVIRKHFDQTQAPAQVLHGGNHHYCRSSIRGLK